jgi:ribosome-binding protein aMBF1 (putative translation factor)
MSDELDVVLAEQMKDPQFAEEYDRLENEYALRELILQARKEGNLSQKELAGRCGMKQSNLSRLENGTGNPTIKTLQQLASGLDRKLEIRFV